MFTPAQRGREERWGGSQAETTPRATTKGPALLFLLLRRDHALLSLESSLHRRVVKSSGEEALWFLTQVLEYSRGSLVWPMGHIPILFYFFPVCGLVCECWKRRRERRKMLHRSLSLPLMPLWQSCSSYHLTIIWPSSLTDVLFAGYDMFISLVQSFPYLRFSF